MDPRVTKVRHDRKAGRELAAAYVLGGRYGPARVPRGIAPEVVLELSGTPSARDRAPRPR
jgi:hypothetical protein